MGRLCDASNFSEFFTNPVTLTLIQTDIMFYSGGKIKCWPSVQQSPTKKDAKQQTNKTKKQSNLAIKNPGLHQVIRSTGCVSLVGCDW